MSAVQPDSLNTLDEPISATLLRDLKEIGMRIKQVLWPWGDKSNVLSTWDLYGPLIFCLVYTLSISLTSNSDMVKIFTIGFTVVFFGAVVVTLNSMLLGGKVSFFQVVCLLGYCVFPLAIGALLKVIFSNVYVRALIALIGAAWAVFASVGFFGMLVKKERRLLAIYPIVLFFGVLAFFIVVPC
ncbi:hypothetical protein KIPB_000221 [Kipferlia bialata]|uniref:Protein YIPF n=1 Tax=Kipferlia bialata TaxID=797122 RepID=A0A9K3CLZ3_9EUKA|nr:hypothetical protein KIPB_000221 [Kipferlia bialata]|eukprot:g221.t1